MYGMEKTGTIIICLSAATPMTLLSIEITTYHTSSQQQVVDHHSAPHPLHLIYGYIVYAHRHLPTHY